MKHVLKTLIIAFTLIVGLMLTSTTYALSGHDNSGYRYNGDYDYFFTEKFESNGTVIREFAKNAEWQTESIRSSENIDSRSGSYGMIKSILSDLGMEEYFINRLTDDDLDKYSSVESLLGITDYKVIADESEKYEIEDNPRSVVIPELDDGWAASTTYANADIRLFLLIAKINGPQYETSIDATWLTTPYFRFVDSLGICADHNTVIYSSCSGWYSWDQVTNFGNNPVFTHETVNLAYTSDSIMLTTGSGYQGAGMLIDLPENVVSGGQLVIGNSNFRAHFGFQSYVTFPTLATYFNVYSTYEHKTYIPAINPSISINASGVTVDIGINALMSSDKWTVVLPDPVYYTPD